MEKSSLKQILQTENYIVTVNPQRNRIYGAIKGGIKEPPEPSQYMEKLHEIKHYVSLGFTALLDVSQGKVQSQEYITFAQYFLELIVEGGVMKIAEVLPDSVILHMEYDRIARLAGTSDKRHVFADREEAEAWLDC